MPKKSIERSRKAESKYKEALTTYRDGERFVMSKGSSVDDVTLHPNGNTDGNVSPNALKDITNQEKHDDEKEAPIASTANISIPKGDTISTAVAVSLKRQSLDSLSLSPSTCPDATALISPATEIAVFGIDLIIGILFPITLSILFI